MSSHIATLAKRAITALLHPSTCIKPITVDSLVSDLNNTAVRLRALQITEGQRAEQLKAQASQAASESYRAGRVALKVEDLLS